LWPLGDDGGLRENLRLAKIKLSSFNQKSRGDVTSPEMIKVRALFHGTRLACHDLRLRRRNFINKNSSLYAFGV
jgi:hypothetical protein